MADGHGGAREGSGRKAKAEKFEPFINAAEDKICDALPQLVDNMIQLANGGHVIVEETFEAAGQIEVETTVRDASGKIVKTKKLAFPGKDPEEMVLVKRVEKTLPCDRDANEYLIDRILGKATERVEVTGEDGGAIPVTVETAIAKVYGKSDADG